MLLIANVKKIFSFMSSLEKFASLPNPWFIIAIISILTGTNWYCKWSITNIAYLIVLNDFIHLSHTQHLSMFLQKGTMLMRVVFSYLMLIVTVEIFLSNHLFVSLENSTSHLRQERALLQGEFFKICKINYKNLDNIPPI